MTKPLVPNWQPGVGQLAVTRWEFEEHITGTKFRHTANQIDLTSPLLGATTVEQVLITISGDLNPSIPQATASVFGTIQLGGDLSGTNSSASTPKVSGLLGRALSATPPTNGQYLVWNGSTWAPTGISLSGDVSLISGQTAVVSIGSQSSVTVPITTALNLTSTLTLGTGGIITSGTGAIVLENQTLSVAVDGTLSSYGTIIVNNPGGLTLNYAEDFVQFGSAHTRTIWNTFTVLNATSTGFSSNWSSINDVAWESIATNQGALSFKIDNLHNGATLTSLTICFSVGQAHSGIPQILPIVTLYRIALGSNSNTQSVVTATGGTPTPSSGANYYNSGHPQTFTLTFTGLSPSGSNIINTAEYAYIVQLEDESGTNSETQNVYQGYSVTYGQIMTDQFP